MVFICPGICLGICLIICLEISNVGKNILKNHGLLGFVSGLPLGGGFDKNSGGP